MQGEAFSQGILELFLPTRRAAGIAWWRKQAAKVTPFAARIESSTLAAWSSISTDLSESNQFDGDGSRFAAADTERRNATLGVACLEGVQQRGSDARAGGADRMAERAG